MRSGHEGHQLRRHRHERPHHVAVLVFEDVAVVHVSAAVGREADGDLDDLLGIDANGVLEPPFVVVDRVGKGVIRVALERDRRDEVAVLDTALRDLVAGCVSSVRLISCQTSYCPSIGKKVVASSKCAAATR